MSTTRSTEYNRRHSQRLTEFNQEIYKRNVLTDVECAVEGQVFKTHRALLACFSPYLKKKLINTEGKPISKRINIPKIGAKEFEILLCYMYSGSMEVDCNTFLEVYKAASLLEMKEVKIECLQRIDGSDEIGTYFYSYILSKKLGIHQHWQKALKLITHRFEETVFSREFMKLDLNYAVEILSSQYIGARSESIVFLAALNWLNHDFGSRGIHTVTMMKCVRFSSMTMEEIVACYHPPILSHIIQIPEVIMMLYRATCYIAAKSQGQETWFKQYASPKRNLALECLPLELWNKRSSSSNTEESISEDADFRRQLEYPDTREQSGADFKRQLIYPDRHEQWDTESELNTRVKNPIAIIAGSTGQETKHFEQGMDRKLKRYGSPIPEEDTRTITELGENQMRRSQPLTDVSDDESDSDEINNFDQAEINFKKDLSRRDELARSREYAIKERIPSKTQYVDSHQVKYVIPETTKVMHLRKGPQRFADKKLKSDEQALMMAAENDTRAKSPFETKRGFPVREESFEDVKESYEDLISARKEKGYYDVSKYKKGELDHQNIFRSSDEVTSSEKDTKKDGCILVVGGMNPKTFHKDSGGAILILNVATNEWKYYTSIPEPRHNHCAVIFAKFLYVVGGCNTQETFEKNCYVAKRSCYKLNLKTSKWSRLSDMNCARYDHALVIYDGKLLAIGGQDDNGSLLKSIEMYEPGLKCWRLLDYNMCCGRKAMGIAVYADRIWIAGGLIQSSQSGQLQAVSHVDCFHPREKKWYFNLYSLPSPRCFCSLTVWDGKLYCLGGMIRTDDGKTSPTNEVWFVDSEDKLWKKGPFLPEPRIGGVAVPYGNNLYFLGGFDPDSTSDDQYVIFLMPGAFSWNTGPPMMSHLFGLSAVSFIVTSERNE